MLGRSRPTNQPPRRPIAATSSAAGAAPERRHPRQGKLSTGCRRRSATVSFISLVQVRVPDDLPSRSFTGLDVLWQSERLLSLLGGGLLADAVGIRRSTCSAGCSCSPPPWQAAQQSAAELRLRGRGRPPADATRPRSRSGKRGPRARACRAGRHRRSRWSRRGASRRPADQRRWPRRRPAGSGR